MFCAVFYSFVKFKYLYDDPTIIVPKNISDRLERIEKPYEAGVRSAEIS